ncbi:MAG TPA: LysR family transcriptional regulator [Pseudomonadales bacterium]|nr:LysR family transcriptional regulator [Pseudomonadales bacterium]
MRNLNFHHLYYFWNVAKEGHLTRAAQRLHVSQSALSSQIRQLEDQFGHVLFSRDGRTLRLTEVGQLVLQYAESIFNLGTEMLSMMESGELERVQRLRIGAVATLSRNFQENFLRPVIGAAEIKLVIHSASMQELLEQLKVHKLDLILSNRPVAAEAGMPWRCQRIAQQSVCLVGPDSDELNQLSFPRDLAKVKTLLPGPSSEIRSQFDMYCESLGILVDPYAEVDDMAMLRLLARDSGGVAVVPEVVVQDEIRAGKLKKYGTLDSVVENFYAITAKRHFDKPVLAQLLANVER